MAPKHVVEIGVDGSIVVLTIAKHVDVDVDLHLYISAVP